MDAKSLRSAKRRRGGFHGVDIENVEIPRLKDFCLETDLSKDVLVAPPEGEAGRKLAERIAQALGKGAEVRPACEVTEEDYGRASIVTLGNVFNNGVIKHLGMNFYSWTDHYFPGEDGYEVRTVHNPYGTGRNVVLLGGSTEAGVERAAGEFLKVLERDGLCLGRINRVVSRHLPEQPPSEAEARQAIERVQEQVALSGGQGPLRQMVDHGMLYYLTGQDVWGEMFRQEFLFFIDLAHRAGDWALAKGTNVYFWGYRMFTAWDVLEEGDVLSEADRLKMTSALYNITRWVNAMEHFRYDSLDQVVQHQNHQTFAASTLFMGARYFKKYYGFKDFDEKLPYARRILEVHARTSKPNDNAGTGYVWLTPGHVIKYALISGDLSYLENGYLGRLLDSAILTIDSRGDDCSYGDVGGYKGGDRSSRPSGLQAVSIGAWFYNDGRYRWLYDWMSKGVEWREVLSRAARSGGGIGAWEGYDGFFFRDIPPVEPVEFLGVRASMLDRVAYDLAVDQARKGRSFRGDPGREIEVPIQEAFDKLAFRRSFDRRSEYLLIDGATAFAHSQEDGNSIIRLCWNDRIWLADMDYIRSLARYHNSVVIVKDGTCSHKPAQVALKAIADFEGWGFSQTVSPKDNGTDWARNVFWRKGRYFLVLDTVEALEDGEYLLDCIWRVLGRVEEKGDALGVEQDGERFFIVNGDGSAKRLTDREADYAPDRANWDGYEHADGAVRMWRQEKSVRLKPGERAMYTNLLHPSNEGMALDLERVGESLVRVLDRRTGEWEALGVGVYREGAFEVEGRLFQVDRNGFSLVEGAALSWEGPVFRSWAPICVEVDFARGKGVIESRCETRVGIRAEAVTLNGKRIPASGEGRLVWFTLPAGRHRVEISPKGEGAFDGLLRGAGAYREERAVRRRQAVAREGLAPVWRFEAGAGVTAAAADGSGQLLVGTAKGEVHLLGTDGKRRWAFLGEGGVRDVHLSDIDGDGVSEAIVGTRDCKLYVLDGRGKARWDQTFPPGSTMRAQRVMKVSAADLEGDGRVQVLAGTEGWLFHAFEADGTLRWQTEIRYHAVTGCLPVDLDGDGKKEILVGTEYYAINCLSSDGAFRWGLTTGCVGPTILAADLDGDGRPEAVYGDWRSAIALRSDTGGIFWRVNMGGETEDLAVADVDGDGKAEVIAGSDIGQLVCIRGNGEVAWRRDLVDKITWLTTVDGDGDGRPEVMVGFDTGEVRVYNGKGELVAGNRVDGEVTYLRAVRVGGAERVVCGTASGSVTLFRPVL